ncbi:unnamed protein product, partial [Didymodactylos carnosus]
HSRSLRLRRQKNEIPYLGWSGVNSNPSGGIPGAFYGSGHNPNSGGYANVHTMIKNIESPSSNNFQVRPNYYGSRYNNIRASWQGNRLLTRYAPGSNGWYAIGGGGAVSNNLAVSTASPLGSTESQIAEHLADTISSLSNCGKVHYEEETTLDLGDMSDEYDREEGESAEDESTDAGG